MIFQVFAQIGYTPRDFRVVQGGLYFREIFHAYGDRGGIEYGQVPRFTCPQGLRRPFKLGYVAPCHYQAVFQL